jgi:DNA-binding winged helix-turn-helix (wHTH) protein/Tfp pilus assembly protein PilF
MRRPGQTYAFGDFRLDPRRRVLSSRGTGETVPLSPAAFDSLLYLVEHAGEVVSRAVLLEAVWPHATVVENSVNQAVSAVRRALGDDPAQPRYLTTVPGRGYRFAAEVVLEDEAARDPETYQLYVAGWSALTRPSHANLAEAELNFEAAIARDPSFALAHSGLAECFVLQASHRVRQPHDAFPKARAAALRALEIDPRSAEAHIALAYAEGGFDRDLPAAARSIARALELNPFSFAAHRAAWVHFMSLGQFDEALAAARRAQAIEPLAASINGNIGMTLYFAGRYEEAIAQLEHTLRMDETWVVARSMLGLCHLRLGRFERAFQEFEHPSSLLHGNPSDLPTAYALSGRPEKAREALALLMRRANAEPVPPVDLARIHAALGEDEAALDWIERAIEERYNHAMIIAVDPAFRSLHGNPRFRQILDRLGLGDVPPVPEPPSAP